jgi:hypothetical protein
MNSTKLLAPAFASLAATGITCGAEPPAIQVPEPSAIVARVRKDHPRLLASAADFARLRQQVSADPQLKQWLEALSGRAGRILAEAPSRYEIPDGLRLLATSRRVLDRVYTLALMYRLENDRRYADRAWKELAAAAGFKDWNPRHFLDTAEMTHAFAIGYDWLYDAWTPEQRTVLRDAVVQHGLTPAQQTYRREKPYGSWMNARHNWNQVCNGGIGIGALAFADELPELAGDLLQRAITSIQLPMREFAPDGAWNEGPGYWNYATTYNIAFLAALQSALGTDFGLGDIPGFSECGMFPIYVTGPLGRTFNYADGGDGAIRGPQMFWLARRFKRPVYAEYENRVASPHVLDLVWYQKPPESPATRLLPLDKYFRGVEVATLRSAWDERDASFVGLKAGDNKANHSNLDLGSFVLDALGTRWALDLGADDYNMPGYFGDQRWTYYRLRAEGQNTLVINPSQGPDQDPKAASRILRFDSKPNKAFAIADLTPAYAKHVSLAHRGVALLDRKRVLIQDEVQAARPAEVWWFMHTRSEVNLSPDKKTATLGTAGARMVARILGPETASFEVMAAQPLPTSPNPAMQNKNEGVRKLAIHVAEVKDARLAVLLVPLKPGESASEDGPRISALNDW